VEVARSRGSRPGRPPRRPRHPRCGAPARAPRRASGAPLRRRGDRASRCQSPPSPLELLADADVPVRHAGQFEPRSAQPTKRVHHAVEGTKDERADEGWGELLRVELGHGSCQEDSRAAVPEVEQTGIVLPLALVDEVVLDLRGEGRADGLLVTLHSALGQRRLQAADRVLELDEGAERVDGDRVEPGATGGHPGGAPGRSPRAPRPPSAPRG
jgi:hypothetical protein